MDGGGGRRRVAEEGGEAAEVLEDGKVADVHEAFLDQLALEWGMDAGYFTAFVENMALHKRIRIAVKDNLERFKEDRRA